MNHAVTDAGIEVRIDGFDQPAIFSWRWLQDHGEDEQSRDPDTLQRRVDTFAIDTSLVGAVSEQSQALAITWPDGKQTVHSHQLLAAVATEFLATDWSQRFAYKPHISDLVTLWPDPASVPDEVNLSRFLTDDAELTHGVEQLSRYGYLVLRGDGPIDGIDQDVIAAAAQSKTLAEAFVARIGYVRQTIFGGMWDLSPDLTAHADTAYTSIYLGPHTDATYSHDAPGLQFFLAVQPASSGGESLLVDGFAIAAELANEDPEAYVSLSSVPVPGRYIEPGVHLRAERPVFRANARGVLDQVSFNNYDRAPLLLPPEAEADFYRAYGIFAEMANDPSRRAAISLNSGDILIFDNWRSLHGRNSFVGYRHYVGAYLNHEDLESKRRVLATSG